MVVSSQSNGQMVTKHLAAYLSDQSEDPQCHTDQQPTEWTDTGLGGSHASLSAPGTGNRHKATATKIKQGNALLTCNQTHAHP